MLDSPDLALSDYNVFASMGDAVTEQQFSDSEEIGKWLDEWFDARDKHKFPQGWAICVESDGQYVTFTK